MSRVAVNNHQACDVLENDLWRACDILRRGVRGAPGLGATSIGMKPTRIS
ncbi:MAG: hypothetical protein ABIJ39_00805 [Chloroflexota bacterium]